MIVVSDTSPLNYLILIGHVDLLPALFDRVIAPPGVIVELSHPGAPQPVKTWAAATPAWLEVIRPTRIDPGLRLGAGENEAISVAQELSANLLLMDERKASRTAQGLGMHVVGTLNVLAVAAERHMVDLPQAIAALRQTTFREPRKLVDELLRRDADRRGGT